MRRCVVRFFIKIIIYCLCKIKTTGLEEVPLNGACIIASNHVGRLDGFLAYAVITRNDIIFMMAKKYKSSFFYRWLINSLNGVWVDQYKMDRMAYAEIEQRIQENGVLCISPEGTRSKTGSLIPGKIGTAYLAAKYKIPVIPVAITGSEDHKVISKLKKLHRIPIKIIFGKAFIFKSNMQKKQKEFLQEYTDEIMCRIAALLPREYRGAYADHYRLKELLKQ